MNRQTASSDTIQNLYNNMGASINLGTLNLCHSVPIVEALKSQLESATEENEKTIELDIQFIFAQLNIFSNIIALDIATAWRANSRAESNFEKRNNLKYLAVITIEGYKYLFGKDRKDRKHTLLRRLEKIAELNGDRGLKDDIKTLRESGRIFTETFLKNKDIDARNFTTHYDFEPIKVYDYLSSIVDEDVEAQRIGLFQSVINELHQFIAKYIEKYNLMVYCNKTTYNLSTKERINIFPDKDHKLFHKMQETISKQTKTLDNIVRSHQMPSKILSDERFSKFDMSEIFAMADSIKPTIHIHFIILDIACALRAYFGSEYYMERQLNLRRINVIIYEGFKKIYGYNEIEKEISFWNNYILKPMQPSFNSTITELSSLLELRLNEIASDPSVNINEVRECLVHYRYKGRDNTVALFKFAFSTSAFGQFFIAQKLICVLPEIMKLNVDLIKEQYRIQTNKIEDKHQEWITKFKTLIKTAESSTDTEDKKKWYIDQINRVLELLENPVEVLKRSKKS